MGRETIGEFFYHSRVPKIDITNFNDTTNYKYTAEPEIKRIDPCPTTKCIHQREQNIGYKWNKYYWLWKANEWIGLRHLFMIFMIIAYTSIGAFLFYRIESRNERVVYPIRVKYLNGKVLDIAKKLKENSSWNISRIFQEFKTDYKDLLAFDNVYKWSAYYRTDVQYKWNPWSATFFAMNLYTTVGYGTIAAETTIGIAVVILYTLLFCPVTMVISRDLGQFGLVYLTKLYGFIKFRYTSTIEKAKLHADDLIILPIKYGWIAMFGFLGITTIFLYYYDGLTGPDVGLSWWECFYFSVQTYTTAGFGDIMPINVTFDPIVGLVYFFCLPVLKVVNRMTYLYLENGIHGYFAMVESKINRYLNNTHTTCCPLSNSQIPCTTLREKDYGSNYEPEWVNNFTIHSLAAMASSSADVFGGNLGRVDLRTDDLLPVHDPIRKPSNAA
ncbi:Ion channel [Necator americanus]|uniref:Ion channel n=1 Tax=Necator americanus TaxID=51031 RepID=W2SP77_NECAM|nr:Ion channel [Necator americanus]ETN70676.1 Ion channel [Necator americanus]